MKRQSVLKTILLVTLLFAITVQKAAFHTQCQGCSPDTPNCLASYCAVTYAGITFGVWQSQRCFVNATNGLTVADCADYIQNRWTSKCTEDSNGNACSTGCCISDSSAASNTNSCAPPGSPYTCTSPSALQSILNPNENAVSVAIMTILLVGFIILVCLVCQIYRCFCIKRPQEVSA